MKYLTIAYFFATGQMTLAKFLCVCVVKIKWSCVWKHFICQKVSYNCLFIAIYGISMLIIKIVWPLQIIPQSSQNAFSNLASLELYL